MKWALLEDEGAPSGKQVVAQLSQDRTNTRYPLLINALVDVSGYLVIQSLVGPFEIEEAEVVGQAEVESGHRVVVMNVDVFIFDGRGTGTGSQKCLTRS